MTEVNASSRLAPSPTGAQHVGNARTFLVAWLDARCRGDQLLLRVEDLDTPRTKAWAVQQAVEDLQWLGLDWDAVAPLQSTRAERFASVMSDLRSRNDVYPCTCTRSQIERGELASIASAPHEPSLALPNSSLDGAVYPGTCQHRTPDDAEALSRNGTPFAWRFRMPPGMVRWHDTLHGPQSLDARIVLGDFVVARSYGPAAYQLAVVVDDHDQAVGRVVRGDDLMYSTFRQNALYAALAWSPPSYFHVPLVVGIDGRRLAKRHGDTRLATLREQGFEPKFLIGQLAHSLALIREPTPITAAELLVQAQRTPEWREQIPRAPWIYREGNSGPASNIGSTTNSGGH